MADDNESALLASSDYKEGEATMLGYLFGLN